MRFSKITAEEIEGARSHPQHIILILPLDPSTSSGHDQHVSNNTNESRLA
jgi:hypothetical protein